MPNTIEPSTVELLATGDLGPNRTDPQSIFALASSRLRNGDIVLGQLEPVLSDRGTPLPQARLAMRSPPATARAIRNAGFNIVSIAGNHCMDWGNDALSDTIENLRASEMRVIGAGKDSDAAAEFSILDRNGTQVALLAYNSIVPMEYEAQANRPGCAPLRGFTHYEQIEHDQPGTPSRVHSFANPTDLEALRSAIADARSRADAVVVSVHWGIHFVPAVIADYQREIAHAAIDAGADVIIGHHPHILKALEIYRGKVIFYSLGNFALDPPTAFDRNLRGKASHREIRALNVDWDDDGEHIVLRASAMAVAARCVFSGGQLKRVSALPVYINRDSQPEFVRSDDPRFAKVADFLAKSTADAGLNGIFSVQGDELVIWSGI
jgi:poly-gamma-glutamate synthesis protein (capsule biosynthesis protein)